MANKNYSEIMGARVPVTPTNGWTFQTPYWYQIMNKIDGIDANTIAMFHFDNNLTDLGTAGISLSNANVTFDSTTKKFTSGYSASFNGSNTKLTGDSKASLNLYGSDFTIDFWVYPNAWATNIRLLGLETAGGDCTGIYGTASGSINIGNFGISSFANAGTIATGSFQHFAFVKASGSFKIYVNGVGGSADTYEPFSDSGDRYLTIGQTTNYTSGWYNGFIDELRISNVARWTSDFIPPVVPYNA